MRKGTFSVQKATVNSSNHNSRKIAPKYLIGLAANTINHYELLKSDNDFIEEAKGLYKNKVGQKMQRSNVKNLILETVLTIQESQNEQDIKDLFIKLHRKYGGHELLELSIHRDEGHFVKDDIAYYPTKNILKKDNDWYVCSDVNIVKAKVSDFDKKVNINNFEKVYNYHAHAKFSMFDRKTSKTARMNRTQMSNRIKFVSKNLGLNYGPGVDSRIRKSVNQIKDEHLLVSQTKELSLVNQKDLKLIISKLRGELKENKSNRADYAKLEELNESLKIEVKQKSLNIESLNKRVESYIDKKDYDKLVEYKETDKSALYSLYNKLKPDVYAKTKGTLFQYIANKFDELKEKIKSLTSINDDLNNENTRLKEELIYFEKEKIKVSRPKTYKDLEREVYMQNSQRME